MGEHDDLLTVTQAAAALDMHRAAIHRAIYDERLPARRIGSMWLIRRADVERYRATPRHPGGRPKRRGGPETLPEGPRHGNSR